MQIYDQNLNKKHLFSNRKIATLENDYFSLEAQFSENNELNHTIEANNSALD